MRDRLRQSAGRKRGPLTGPNPTDRGKLGSKIHLITDRNGLPLSLGISGANMHDSLGLEPLVRGIPPIRSRRGPRRRKPAKPPPHRPQGRRVLTATGQALLGGRKNRVLAGRLPKAPPSLRTQGRALPRLRRHSRNPHRLSTTRRLRRRLLPEDLFRHLAILLRPVFRQCPQSR